MNVGAIIAGIAVAASGVACLFLACYHYMELQFEVNERLPDGQKFEPLFWTLLTRQQFRQLQKRVLPESTRPKRALRLTVAGFCLFFSGTGWLLVFGKFH